MKSLRKKTTATLLTAIFILSILTIAIPIASAQGGVTNERTGLDYITIQHAIDALETFDGDTIIVAAGTYSTSTNGEVFPLTVSKSLTLKGAQFGVDPTLPEARTNEEQESVIDASGFECDAIEIAANDVTIDGFTFKNMHGEPIDSSPDAKYVIRTLTKSEDHSIYSSDITIQNNILTDNSRGIGLFDNENSLVKQNRIVKCESLVAGLYGWWQGGSGIVLTYVKPTTIITENLLSENVAKVSYYAPILISQGGYATQPTIVNNQIINNYRETTISYGIVLSGSTAIIRGNTITGNEGGGIWSRMGSSGYFQGPESLLIIEDNMITENAQEGIYIVNNLPGASITGNTISDNGGWGVSVGTGDYTIHENNILGNGHGVSAGVPTDVTLNWWGTTDLGAIAEMVSINLDFDPCLYERVPMTLNVPGQFSTIQAAINAADLGDTVIVAAGTYTEPKPYPILRINKPLTLLGAQADVEPVTGGRLGGESVLTHPGGIIIEADDVVINGFEIIPTSIEAGAEIGGYGISDSRDGETNNVQILYNYIHYKYDDAFRPNTANAAIALMLNMGTNSATYNDYVISHNYIDWGKQSSVYGKAIHLGGGSAPGHQIQNRVEVSYNTIKPTHKLQWGIAMFYPWTSEVMHPVIKGNKIYDCIIAGIEIHNMFEADISDNVIEDTAYCLKGSMEHGTIRNNVFKNTLPVPWDTNPDEEIEDYTSYGLYLMGEDPRTPLLHPSQDIEITDNDFYFNTAPDTYGALVDVVCDASTIEFHHNNFYDGGSVPDAFALVNNVEDVPLDATLNFWDTIEESLIQGMFSGPVDYDPWFGQEPKVEETLPGPAIVEALDEADTIVEKTGDGTPTVSVAEFTENPEEGFTNDAGKYYDVKIDSPAGVESLTLRFYYTDADLGGITETTLVMKWYDSIKLAWFPCSDQTLYTESDKPEYSGYIEVLVTDSTYPSLNDMTGTPFGFEGELPEVADERCDLSVSGDVIVEAAEDATIVYASSGDTAEITVEMDLAGYHGDIHFTLYKKVDGGLAYIDEIRTVYGVELKGSRTANWIVDQNPGNYVVWINIDLIEKVQLTGLDEALHIGPIEVIII